MPLGDASSGCICRARARPQPSQYSQSAIVSDEPQNVQSEREMDEMSQRVRACRGAQIESISISTQPAAPSLPIRVRRHLVHVQTNGRGGRERRGPLPSPPLVSFGHLGELALVARRRRRRPSDRLPTTVTVLWRDFSINEHRWRGAMSPPLVCSLGSAARSPAPANGNIIGPSNLFQRRDGSAEISAPTRWKAERPRGCLAQNNQAPSVAEPWPVPSGPSPRASKRP